MNVYGCVPSVSRRVRRAWSALLLAGAGGVCGQPGACPLPPVAVSPHAAIVEPVLRARQGAPIDSLVLAVAPNDGSGRLFIVERTGKVRIHRAGTVLPTPFLDLSATVLTTNARGLLGFAFHADFAAPGAAGEGRLYTWHNETAGPPADFPAPGPTHQCVLCEWRVSSTNADSVDPASKRELFRVDHLSANHSGGGMAFDSRKYLYLTFGTPAGHTGRGQDNSHPDGTVVRIDPLDPALTPLSPDPPSGNGRYRIPADNPLVGVPGAASEVYAWGLRHPWRISIDPVNDQPFVGDVGQGSYEEVNAIVRGGNYGWPYREGFCEGVQPMPFPAPELIAPLAAYDRDEGRSVIGGHVYRGSALLSLFGKLVFADLTAGSGQFFAVPGRVFVMDVYDSNGALIAPGSGHMQALQIGPDNAGLPLAPVSFGTDAAGELLLIGVDTPFLGDAIYRLAPPPLEMNWNTIDGGGGVAAGGLMTMVGTIGQPDAGILSDGAGLTMLSGFWGLGGGAPPPCYADCDASTGPRILDIFDFLCFQNQWESRDDYACNCDTSTGMSVCDVFDYLCFQNAYAAGCP